MDTQASTSDMKNRLYHEDVVCRDSRIRRTQDTCKAFMLCSSKFGFGQSKVWIWLGNTATQLFSAVCKHNFCSLAYRHMLPKHTFYQQMGLVTNLMRLFSHRLARKSGQHV